MTRTRHLTPADALTEHRIDGDRIVGGELTDRSHGYRMSAMTWRLEQGAGSAIAVPADEVWVVAAGEIELRTDTATVVAGPGDVLLVPRWTPGTARARRATRFLTVAHPPSWTADHGDVPEPTPPPAGPVTLLTAAAPARTPDGLDLTVSLAHRRDGEVHRRTDVRTDEAVVVTRGTMTLRLDGHELPVRAGELAYLAAGRPGELRATGDAALAAVRLRPGRPA